MMQTFKFAILGTSVFILTGCSHLYTNTVEKDTVCRDKWYGHVCMVADPSEGILRALQPEISNGTISVNRSIDSVRISLASELLFDSGQEQLKSEGSEALKRVGSILKDFHETQIFVSGYTDNLPIIGALQKKFPSNQELSDARANSAAQALREGGVRSNLTVLGYADQRPIASNDTVEGRAKNRRVEVVVAL